MYCSKCGFQLPDDSKFCNSCGWQVSNALASVSTAVQEVRQENPYDRDVTLIHLYDLRMLEMAREKLKTNWANVDYKINNAGIPKNYRQPSRDDFSPEYKITDALGVFFFTGVVLVGGYALNFITRWLFDSNFLLVIAIIVAALSGAYGVFSIFSRIREESENEERYQNDVELTNQAIINDKLRVKKELIEKEQLLPVRDDIYAEWKKVDALLATTYEANIIPSQYRNLYAVYYLYEFLSTSQESLKEALLHCDLDAIKQKLDAIIQQQQEIIIQQAITNSHLEHIQAQNEKLLHQAIQIEKNTAKATQYAKAAAANTEAIAYIGVAQYISKNF